MNNKIQDIIFGKNDLQKIVNITCTENKAFVFVADGDKTYKYTAEHLPYVLRNEEYQDAIPLSGKGHYKFISPLKNTDYGEIYDQTAYKPRTIEEGFMLLEGYTYYKGMKVDEISLLSFDIEATTLDPKDPGAKVLMISTTYRSRSGVVEKNFFDILDYSDEVEMITAFCNWVTKKDPDVLLGHNVFGYDLPYLNSRCPLPMGRDGSNVRFNRKPSKKRKDQQQQYKYYDAHVCGRDIIDTMFLSLTYDVSRKFPSYGLKSIEKYLDLVSDDRIDWDFKAHHPKTVYELAALGDTDLWNKFRDYCKDDSDSLLKLFDKMAPSYFYLANSIPKKFQQIINEATGSQIDCIMIRSYLQEGKALPRTSSQAGFEGAISMGIPGLYKNVRKVDVASLYPSIMRQYKVYPKAKDPDRNFLKILDYFTEERLKNKKLGKESTYHKNLSDAQKIVINSMYGFMGANFLLFNDPKGAAEVTRHGRDILQVGVKWATGGSLERVVDKVVNKDKENQVTHYKWVYAPGEGSGKGYTLVNVDTDSFSYTNGEFPGKNEFQNEITELNSLYPDLITWEDDGVFEKFLVVKAKNYVMESQGKIEYKGSSIKDQKKEPALRTMMDELFKSIMDESDSIDAILHKYYKMAMNIKDIHLWSVKKTVTSSVMKATTPAQKNIKSAIENKQFSEGDKIWLYVDEVPEFEGNVLKKKYKLVEDFDGKYHKWHYVKRVYDTLTILENLIDIKIYPKYYNKAKRKSLEGIINGKAPNIQRSFELN